MKVSLPNGCSCSQPKVSPKTWDRVNASVKKEWYIHYRFYDPLFADKYPNGYSKQIKGMNEYKVVKDRQIISRRLLENEVKLLTEQAYNPITGIFTPIEEIAQDYIISPEIGLADGLQASFARIEGIVEDANDIKSTLKFIQKAIAELRLENLPIKNIRRRHAVMILDQCGKTKETWTASTYNRYRKNLGRLFRELIKVEAMELQPVDEFIELKKGTQDIKELLTPEEIKLINTRLRELNFPFWRFIHIFCNSGSRTPEIMKVKDTDVDLIRQTVRYTIKKDKVIRKVERPIKDDVLHLWEQLIVEAKKVGPGCYLFSEGLHPGKKSIRTDQIRHRWRLWVQIKLGIKKTWYSLKYLNTDYMDSLYGSQVAAELNKHNESMVNKYYAVNQKERRNEVIKKAPNPLMI